MQDPDWYFLCMQDAYLPAWVRARDYYVTSGQRERDELELLALLRGVDEQDLACWLVRVEREVLPVDSAVRLRVAEREELEVLEQPGLDGAHERGEASKWWIRLAG